MITRKTFLVTTFAIALGVLAVSATIGWDFHHQDSRSSSAAWKVNYQGPNELVNDVDVIALAQAVAATPSRVAYSDTGEDALPFQAIEFTVVQGIKGVEDGGQLVVERAGGIYPDGAKVNIDADGGDFVEGGTYLLFLKRQEDGPFYYQVNDQGRFQVVEGHLKAVDDDDPVAEHFQDKTPTEAVRLVRQFMVQ
jgi:hypothetical protein